jgi:hypothetical protein
MVNSLIGIVASLLLKDNAVVAWVIGTLVIGTVIFIERAWLNEQLFRNSRKFAWTAYTVLGVLLLVGLFFVTEPGRRTTAVITSTSSFLNGIKSGAYKDSYAQLSQASQQEYPLAEFIEDHANGRVKIQDFTINQVTFNRFDTKKALAVVSSPFMLYGHETLHLELIKESAAWKIVLSRKTVAVGKTEAPLKTKKKNGVITNIFNTLF